MDNNAKKGLNDIMGGYNPYQELRSQTKKLVKKWAPSGLLEGLDNESFDQHSMAILLENQARQLIDEASPTSHNTTSGKGDEDWSGVALPLVRKVFGEIASKDFVSVQPMNLPSGLVFYLNFTYGSGRDDFTKGGSIHGTTDGKDSDASGGFYGAGKYGFTANSSSVAATAASWTLPTRTATPKQVQFDNTGSDATYYELQIGLPSDADVDAVRSFQIEDVYNGGNLGLEPKYTTVTKSGTTYSASFFVTTDVRNDTIANGLGILSSSALHYSVAPTAAARGDFEQGTSGFSANPETDINIPEIDVDLKSTAIVAKTRKLKAVWTPELAQDLNAYHSIDAEAELTSMLSEYISMEIDLEILDMLISNASTTEYWSADIGQEYNSSTNEFAAATNASSYAYTKNEWFQTLGNKIQRVSNKIHQKTMRGGANFLVAGPDVCTVIESIPGWNVNTDGNQSSFAMGVEQVGTLRNRWTVYKNPYMNENTILCGFRGSNFLETGAVYAPYIPLIVTPLIYDPKNFQPRKGVMTRYAKKIVRPEFYGKIVVADADKI